MADRGKGIDLLDDPPSGEYLASMLCIMAGIKLGDYGDGPGIEEFRITVDGIYVRTEDDQEFHLGVVRTGHVLEFPFIGSSSFICSVCGTYKNKRELHKESGDRCKLCAVYPIDEEGVYR